MNTLRFPREKSQHDAFEEAKRTYARLERGAVLRESELEAFLARLDQLSLFNEGHAHLILQVRERLDIDRRQLRDGIMYCLASDPTGVFPRHFSVPARRQTTKLIRSVIGQSSDAALHL